MRYQLSGVSYYVHTEGKGEPLLLHGFTGSSQTWRAFMKKFAKDYQVIAVDIIGHGQSAARKKSNHIQWKQLLKHCMRRFNSYLYHR